MEKNFEKYPQRQMESEDPKENTDITGFSEKKAAQDIENGVGELKSGLAGLKNQNNIKTVFNKLKTIIIPKKKKSGTIFPASSTFKPE